MKELAKILILKPLYNLLIFFAAIIPGNSIGWAIILLTIFVRLILLLPSRRSLIAQRKLQQLQPHLEQLKQRHKGDQQAQAQATMALYREHGVSPFGACLPALIQLPILFILYYVLRIGLSTEHFDLLYSFTPRPDTINTDFFGVNLAVPEPWVLPLSAGVSQLVASWQLLPKSKPKSQAQPDIMGSFSRQMLYIFPVMTFVIARTLPAALSVYWIATTLFSIVQQYFINKHIKEVDLPALKAGEPIHGIQQRESKRGVEVVVRKKSSS